MSASSMRSIRRCLVLAALLVPAALRDIAGQETSPEGIHAVSLAQGRSHTVRAPWLVKRISVTNPEVADVQAISPNQILILGKALGATDVFLFSEEDDIWQAQVEVIANLAQLKAVLGEMFPDAELRLSQSNEVVVVSGVLARAEHVTQLRSLLEGLELKYVDRTRLAGVQQVQIQIRIAEVSRTALKALSVNAFQVGEDAFGALNVGPATGGSLNPINIGVPEGALAQPNIPFFFPNDLNVSPLVTAFLGFPDHNLQAFVRALAENQYLRLLAEPNLVALSGEEASFLAGGEFPIPVVQGGTNDSTAITIEYKEFGVRLNFRPEVLGDATIRLEVAPEVSELSDVGSVEIQGFRIPGVLTRRASTTLELKSGQTFAIAGLLSSRREAQNSRVPLLGDIPIIGALFRSTRYTKGETELVVLATASLVEPLSLGAPPPLPGTLEIPENDWEIFLEGSISGELPAGVAHPDGDAMESLELERLKGPGAWASYGDRER